MFERLDSGFATAGPGQPAGLGASAASPPGGPPGHGLPSGLPSYWTRAYGLELTALRLRALVRAQRLVTVHGPGGSGKTRLAVAVAQACCDGPDGPDGGFGGVFCGAFGGASKGAPGSAHGIAHGMTARHAHRPAPQRCPGGSTPPAAVRLSFPHSLP